MECLRPEKGEGGGAHPSAMRPAYSSVDRMPKKTSNSIILSFFNLRSKAEKMHAVSKYKHLASTPTDTQKGTAENYTGIEQVWEGRSEAIQSITSGQ